MSLIRPALAVAALAALLLPLGAVAQSISSPYRHVDTRHDAGVIVGLMQENRGELELGPGGGVFAGLRYGIQLGGPFVFEVQSFLLPTDRKVFRPTQDGVEYLGDTDALVGAIEGRIRFNLTGPRSWNHLVPFVLAGGGMVGNFYGRSSLEEEFEARQRFTLGPSFLGTLGGGAQWLPTERLILRVEGNMNLWKLGTPRDFFLQAGEGVSIPEQEWPAVGALVFGGSFRF